MSKKKARSHESKAAGRTQAPSSATRGAKAGGGSHGPVKNIANMSQFEREVLSADKPVIVDFWAPWCGPCRAMAPIFEAMATEHHEDIVFAKVNTDSVPAVAEEMGIRSLPTLLAFWQGDVVDIKIGVTPAPGMERLIQNLKKKAGKPQSAASPDDSPSLYQRVKGWLGVG